MATIQATAARLRGKQIHINKLEAQNEMLRNKLSQLTNGQIPSKLIPKSSSSISSQASTQQQLAAEVNQKLPVEPHLQSNISASQPLVTVPAHQSLPFSGTHINQNVNSNMHQQVSGQQNIPSGNQLVLVPTPSSSNAQGRQHSQLPNKQAQQISRRTFEQKQRLQHPQADFEELESFFHNIEHQFKTSPPISQGQGNPSQVEPSTKSCMASTHQQSIGKQHVETNVNIQFRYATAITTVQPPHTIANHHASLQQNNPGSSKTYSSCQQIGMVPPQQFQELSQSQQTPGSHNKQQYFQRLQQCSQQNFARPQNPQVVQAQHQQQQNFPRPQNPQQASQLLQQPQQGFPRLQNPQVLQFPQQSFPRVQNPQVSQLIQQPQQSFPRPQIPQQSFPRPQIPQQAPQLHQQPQQNFLRSQIPPQASQLQQQPPKKFLRPQIPQQASQLQQQCFPRPQIPQQVAQLQQQPQQGFPRPQNPQACQLQLPQGSPQSIQNGQQPQQLLQQMSNVHQTNQQPTPYSWLTQSPHKQKNLPQQSQNQPVQQTFQNSCLLQPRPPHTNLPLQTVQQFQSPSFQRPPQLQQGTLPLQPAQQFPSPSFQRPPQPQQGTLQANTVLQPQYSPGHNHQPNSNNQELPTPVHPIPPLQQQPILTSSSLKETNGFQRPQCVIPSPSSAIQNSHPVSNIPRHAVRAPPPLYRAPTPLLPHLRQIQSSSNQQSPSIPQTSPSAVQTSPADSKPFHIPVRYPNANSIQVEQRHQAQNPQCSNSSSTSSVGIPVQKSSPKKCKKSRHRKTTHVNQSQSLPSISLHQENLSLQQKDIPTKQEALKQLPISQNTQSLQGQVLQSIKPQMNDKNSPCFQTKPVADTEKYYGPFEKIVKEEQLTECCLEGSNSVGNNGFAVSSANKINIEESLDVSAFLDLENMTDACASSGYFQGQRSDNLGRPNQGFENVPIKEEPDINEPVSSSSQRSCGSKKDMIINNEPGFERNIDCPPQSIITPPQTPPMPIPSTSRVELSAGVLPNIPPGGKNALEQSCHSTESPVGVDMPTLIASDYDDEQGFSNAHNDLVKGSAHDNVLEQPNNVLEQPDNVLELNPDSVLEKQPDNVLEKQPDYVLEQNSDVCKIARELGIIVQDNQTLSAKYRVTGDCSNTSLVSEHKDSNSPEMQVGIQSQIVPFSHSPMASRESEAGNAEQLSVSNSVSIRSVNMNIKIQSSSFATCASSALSISQEVVKSWNLSTNSVCDDISNPSEVQLSIQAPVLPLVSSPSPMEGSDSGICEARNTNQVGASKSFSIRSLKSIERQLSESSSLGRQLSGGLSIQRHLSEGSSIQRQLSECSNQVEENVSHSQGVVKGSCDSGSNRDLVSSPPETETRLHSPALPSVSSSPMSVRGQAHRNNSYTSIGVSINENDLSCDSETIEADADGDSQEPDCNANPSSQFVSFMISACSDGGNVSGTNMLCSDESNARAGIELQRTYYENESHTNLQARSTYYNPYKSSIIENPLAELDSVVEFVEVTDNTAGHIEIANKRTLSPELIKSEDNCDFSSTTNLTNHSNQSNSESATENQRCVAGTSGSPMGKDFFDKIEWYVKKHGLDNLKTIEECASLLPSEEHPFNENDLHIYLLQRNTEDGKLTDKNNIPEKCPMCYTPLCPLRFTMNTHSFNLKTKCTGCDLTIRILWGKDPKTSASYERPCPKSKKRKLKMSSVHEKCQDDLAVTQTSHIF